MEQAGTAVIGFTLAAVISGLAWRLRALSASGSMAATVLGTLAVLAGWAWAVVLVGYFVGAALLSRWRSAEKSLRSAGRMEKEGARDAVQVLANGGVFALAATAAVLWPHQHWSIVAAGAISASASDTWATEIGLLSIATPRSLPRWRQVAAGTSGGVTAYGLAGGVTGACFVALLAWAVSWQPQAVIAAFTGGVIGCLADSLIGATIQARRWCGACDVPTERRVHRCGTATSVIGGLSWLDNDGVNFAATICGAVSGLAIATSIPT